MTLHIPAQVVAVIAYTAILLIGAFGISYAVHEWRDDSDSRIESLDERLLNTGESINFLVRRSRTCHDALREVTVILAQIQNGTPPTLADALEQITELGTTMNTNC